MQLELFDQPKGPASIYQFPLARRRSLVIEIAGELAARDYDGGRLFWKKHAAEMRRRLKASGLSRPSIKAELDAYASAVGRQARILEKEKLSSCNQGSSIGFDALDESEASAGGSGAKSPRWGSQGQRPCALRVIDGSERA